MACNDSHTNYLQQGRKRVHSRVAPEQPCCDTYAEIENRQRRHIA
jgi:hypothetical protein